MFAGISTAADGIGERFRHPVAGVALFIWPLYNWKIWPHWFADTSAEDKISAISAVLCDQPCGLRYWAPWAIALVLVLMTPLLGWIVALARE